ncbi:hypothetical protein [Methylobacillus flagellatus]|uniref:TIGR02449 family protein n=1 Tax=Methylobacillus flagellatus (strain ATCC 51484 / DSM 6875 / VKM B-1610 / KT) TaxID=265072 RepID=Q1GXJ0_METFK|nr:hypothetical protein [Methylobacillus flagellatus]ABE48394.1 conserved hypothetical protein [Methylobacillus flagellatus KT]
MNADLIMLEEKLTQLISLCQLLRAENLELRQELVRCQDDSKQLKENMELASQRLQALIERLPEGTV